MESTHTHSFCRLAGEILAVKQGEAFDCIKPVLSLFVDFAWYTDVDSAFVFAPLIKSDHSPLLCNPLGLKKGMTP